MKNSLMLYFEFLNGKPEKQDHTFRKVIPYHAYSQLAANGVRLFFPMLLLYVKVSTAMKGLKSYNLRTKSLFSHPSSKFYHPGREHLKK